MTDAQPKIEVEIVDGICKIPRESWDAVLTPDDSPFVEWDWLYAMEQSGSATRETGWAPYHIVVREAPRGRIVAACPLYLKSHSMVEFVFDHPWADAAERAGIRYYPKLLVGVPFTPHTGRRFLTAPGADRAMLGSILGRTLISVCEDNHLSSVHINFCEPDEAAALVERGFLERLGHQYHWHNAGYASFDYFLQRFRHKRRTAVRHERAAMAGQGVEIRVATGDEIPNRLFPEMFRIYLSTIEKLYWGRQYLTAEFFDLLRNNFRRNLCFIGAHAGGELVGGAICVEKAQVLYGRYWGCFRDVRFLHFNVCYYAGIEHCIKTGIRRYEPGAGGEYKWLRGFDPALTRSMHYISDERLRKAIASFVAREGGEIGRLIEAGPNLSQLKPPPPSDEERE
ncbi:MAG TPA: GNAT family N-acetyltransferase [Candidatus Binataceae bacterium]|nr:GNAT family N-acetyltransferase [Candidatus Binataceae bacterium]